MTTATLPTPVSLGLPKKFQSFRPGQYEAATQVVDALATTRNVFLIQPPGAGKSLVYFTVAELLSHGHYAATSSSVPFRTLVLTGTKALQDQVARDFTSMGAYVLKGADNYPCKAVEVGGELEGLAEVGIGCGSKAPCRAGHECELKGLGCGYYDARREAAKARIVVANYALWMALGAYGQGKALGSFDLLVCDEAHGAHGWMDNFLSARFTQKDFQLIGEPPKGGTEQEVGPWMIVALTSLRDEYKKQPPGEYRKTLEALGRKVRKGIALLKVGGNSVVEEKDHPKYGKQVTISPIWCSNYTEPILRRTIPRCLYVSATMGKSTPKRLGVEDGDAKWVETTEGFPSGRRPVIVVKSAPRVSWKMGATDLTRWSVLILNACKARSDRKGLIHTRSYARAKDIRCALTGEVATADLPIELSARCPVVLVGPNFEEGVDFPYDLCRYILIPKIPFLDRRDPVTKARMESDPRYEWDLIAETIMQMAGRGMRAEDDWCETLVLDGSWGAVKRNCRFPEWFRVAIREVQGLPGPMVDPSKRKGLR